MYKFHIITSTWYYYRAFSNLSSSALFSISWMSLSRRSSAICSWVLLPSLMFALKAHVYVLKTATKKWWETGVRMSESEWHLRINWYKKKNTKINAYKPHLRINYQHKHHNLNCNLWFKIDRNRDSSFAAMLSFRLQQTCTYMYMYLLFIEVLDMKLIQL